jgi:predicted MFS family arabinose efflux permease
MIGFAVLEPKDARLVKSRPAANSILAPLRLPVYRGSWAASLISNSSGMILGVGAGWAMTQMTRAADQVALVQTALMLPVTLLALPAGAVADMYDRRGVAMAALGTACLGAALLVAVSMLGALTPASLLAFCFLIAGGAAVFNPAWQASVNDQVPHDMLPAAVSLNSISFNIARSLGPAIGGIVVAAAGAGAAFLGTAAGYVPMLAVLYGWPRRVRRSDLPPEGIRRGVMGGLRYVAHSPQIVTLLTRTLLMALAGAATPALMPLIVRNQLHGDARVFGAMLAAFGVGGIVSALLVPRVRHASDPEWTVRVCLFAQAFSAIAVGLSHSAILTGLALIVSGASWMMATVHFNVGVQLSAPRWVSARVLATFQATITGGTGLGSWGWGVLAERTNLQTPYLWSAVGMILTLLVGLKLRVPHVDGSHREAASGAAPAEAGLSIDGRSGPVELELQYRVAVIDGPAFQAAMLEVRRSRLKNGASAWRLTRDAAQAETWVERWRFPTWHDYLRQLDRASVVDLELLARASGFHAGAEPPPIRLLVAQRQVSVTPGEASQALP